MEYAVVHPLEMLTRRLLQWPAAVANDRLEPVLVPPALVIELLWVLHDGLPPARLHLMEHLQPAVGAPFLIFEPFLGKVQLEPAVVSQERLQQICALFLPRGLQPLCAALMFCTALMLCSALMLCCALIH
jgi:hypothetical protein